MLGWIWPWTSSPCMLWQPLNSRPTVSCQHQDVVASTNCGGFATCTRERQLLHIPCKALATVCCTCKAMPCSGAERLSLTIQGFFIFCFQLCCTSSHLLELPLTTSTLRTLASTIHTSQQWQLSLLGICQHVESGNQHAFTTSAWFMTNTSSRLWPCGHWLCAACLWEAENSPLGSGCIQLVGTVT